MRKGVRHGKWRATGQKWRKSEAVEGSGCFIINVKRKEWM